MRPPEPLPMSRVALPYAHSPEGELERSCYVTVSSAAHPPLRCIAADTAFHGDSAAVAVVFESGGGWAGVRGPSSWETLRKDA